MNLNLMKFRIVELLAQHHKITHVAELLELKQPTVTFHMKNMEREFGVQLFESRANKIYLTEAGEALRHYAQKINVLAQDAERVVKEFNKLERGSIRIGASYVPGTYILPAILSSFAQEYPQIMISLVVKTSPVIKDMLINHEIDIGIISTEPFQLPPLVSEMICEDDLVVILSPHHPLTKYPELNPALLAKVPFILHGPESSTRHLTDKWALAHNMMFHAHLEMDSVEAIKQSVMLGNSAAFISRLAVNKEAGLGELEIRPIPNNSFKRFVYLSYNQERRQSALIAQFTQHLQHFMQQ